MAISETEKRCPFEEVEGPTDCPYPRNLDLPVSPEKCENCFETFRERGQKRRFLGIEDGVEKVLITGRHNQNCLGPYHALEYFNPNTKKRWIASSYCENCRQKYYYTPKENDD